MASGNRRRHQIPGSCSVCCVSDDGTVNFPDFAGATSTYDTFGVLVITYSHGLLTHQCRAACPATSVVGKGVRRVEGRSGSTSALEVVDPRNGITNHDNSLDTEELSRRVNSKAHVLSSSSEDNCQSGERDDSQLTGEDTDNDIDSKHKRLPELPREMADSDGCALQSEISAIGNDSSKTLPKDSSKDALDTLKFLCARRVLPAVLVSSESTGVSTYSAKAVACMVHAACMVAEVGCATLQF